MKHYQQFALTPVIQDGPDFYVEASGALIESYPTMVRNDLDMEGAEAARVAFLAKWGHLYRMDPDPFKAS